MKQQRLVHISPWLLAAACTLLAVIIGVFAATNYRREKELMTESLLQQGLTIIRFVTAGSRSSMRGNMPSTSADGWHWTDPVQQGIEHSADHPGVHFVGLLDGEGNILAATDEKKIQDKIDSSTRQFLRQLEMSGEQGRDAFVQRMVEREEDRFFQVVSLFQPFGHGNFMPPGRGPRWMRSEGVHRGMASREFLQQMQELRDNRYVLLVELDLDEFDRAMQRQLVQILSLSLALLLVGVGGWLSLLTLQGLKGSQQRLRQMRLSTDLLVSSLPIGLISTDNLGKIRIFNGAAQDMVGLRAEEVLGENPEMVLPPQLWAELKQKELPSRGAQQKEIVLTDALHNTRSLMSIALPVVDSNKQFAGNTLLLQDVSQVKKLQQELRRNERMAALGKMAAGVAHELRNPLSSIKGLALLLKARVQKGRQNDETADILIQEVERLNRSIGELLDFARPHRLQLEKVDIAALLDKAVTLIAADADFSGIAITRAYDGPMYVHGDPDKLSQVFLNLLLNAVQAMEHGGTLRLVIELQGETVMCTVADSGCGIDEENAAKVFDPYFTTKSEGTGLGLAMSAKIVEEHSGTIEFSSALGSGTTVRIILPAYKDESLGGSFGL